MTGRKLSLILVGIALLSACNKGDGKSGATSATSSADAAHDAKLPALTVDEVDARLAKNDGTFFVFDANKKDLHDGTGHLPGAKWVAFDDVKAADLPPSKDATLVFYCMNDH